MSQAGPKRVAVIGGGITGLACAHRLVELGGESSPFEITLFEAGSRWGGAVGTLTLDGYLIEQGADNFLTDKPWGVDLCHRIGLEDRIIATEEKHRGSLVIRDGKPVPVPEGFVLMAPSKIGPILKTPIFSLQGKLRMAYEYFVPPRIEPDDESVAHFIRRRFGHEVLDRLVQPLVGGIYTADPEKLSLAATLPRFVKMEREHGSLIRAMRLQARAKAAAVRNTDSGARYGLFVAFPNGMSELIDRLVERISPHATLRLNSPIASLAFSSDKYSLTTSDGTTEEFDAVVLTTPAYRTAELVKPIDEPLATALTSIEYASSVVVVSGHRLQDIRHSLDAFGLVVPACEKRNVLAISFSSRKFPDRSPKGEVLLRTFIGGALQPELVNLSDAELEQLARNELHDLLGVTGEPTCLRVVRYPRGMPQYNVGHQARVSVIFERMNAHPRLALAGNAYQGVGIPDCIHSGEQAAMRIQSGCRSHNFESSPNDECSKDE
ncbi:MAG: protoporphyrinogen oxidase [Planctomycetota bacterium]|nr:protoporphyrinogen oxidase [Planctomycetota bacterium]MDA1214995.1 protoporphyrinogen oxidase [Planctomycetota bacterium]